MRLGEYVKKNANIPNLLTLLRLALVPVYVVLFAQGRKYPALVVFLAACFTDLLDGFLARKLHQITDFGKLVDPFADKVMVLTAMFSMAIGNAAIPAVIPWAAVIILLLKEGVMVVGGLVMLRHHIVVYSNLVGKIAQVLFIGALVATYFHDPLTAACPTWPMSPDLILIWLAVANALGAMVFYIVDSVRQGRERGIIGPKAAGKKR